MTGLPPLRNCLLLTLTILLFGSNVPTLAYQPMHQNDLYEIKLPEFSPLDQSAPDLVAAGEAVSAALETRYGGQWKVFSHNSHSRTPHYVYGSGTRYNKAVRGPADLEVAARQVITDNPTVFKADQTNLRLSATPHAKGKWVAHFQQTYHGIDVWEGKALVAFSDDGRLLLIGSDYYSDIAVEPQPSLSESFAVQIAVDDLPFNPATDQVEEEVDLLVLPYPMSVTEVEHHLVYRVRVHTSEPLGIWVTHVDAHSGEVLWRYNDVHFDYLGDSGSNVQEDTYCNGITTQVMPYLRVTVNGVGTVITDGYGSWNVAGSGGTRSVTADLYGPYVDLNNVAGGEALFSGNAEEGVPLTVAFNDLNAQRDERDVFDAINDVHDFFELFASGFSYTQQRITANVSRTDGYCPGNAWWNGTINFCSVGGGYANTGEIQGVAQHEFGHGVQDAILGWQGDEGLGEGNSDILAVLMTQDPVIGRGFYLNNCTSGIRNAANGLIYPDDVVGQGIHYAGQVILGFNWDAMVLMQAAYGTEEGTLIAASNWHYGRVLLMPTNQPDQVFATFFADDDDGFLDNGTPNHIYYSEAADNHNFDYPEILIGVLFSHTPLQDTTDTDSPYTLQATIFSTEAELDPSSVTLFWRANNGPWRPKQMTSLGSEDLYTASIPAQPSGQVEYYLYAEDLQGNDGSIPRTAPDDVFDFLVAWQIDPLELAGDWSVGAPDDDATTGIWVHVDPIPTSAQPDDDHTVEGTMCWITGQHQPGEGDGFNDVDGGKTTLLSPVFDFSVFEEVTIRYWKWYSNDRGSSPGNDFWDVELSNDGGATWTALEHTVTSTNEWRSVTANLLDYFPVPDQVQLKFVAADEGSGSLIEAGVDDLVIVALSGTTGVGDGDMTVRVVTELDQNVPNPFNPRTEINFSLQRPQRASLKVFDIQGHLVKTLAEGDLPAGPQRVFWDGSTHGGRPVAAGVYIYRLETEDQIMTKRMLLVK